MRRHDQRRNQKVGPTLDQELPEFWVHYFVFQDRTPPGQPKSYGLVHVASRGPYWTFESRATTPGRLDLYGVRAEGGDENPDGIWEMLYHAPSGRAEGPWVIGSFVEGERTEPQIFFEEVHISDTPYRPARPPAPRPPPYSGPPRDII